jgi:hypothetical protein
MFFYFYKRYSSFDMICRIEDVALLSMMSPVIFPAFWRLHAGPAPGEQCE